MRARFAFVAVLLAFAPAAQAQDVRGLEVCTAEKDMARRTSCLQANVEFLQQALAKQAKEARDHDAASARELDALKAGMTALKASLAKMQGEIAEMKKAKPAEAKKP